MDRNEWTDLAASVASSGITEFLETDELDADQMLDLVISLERLQTALTKDLEAAGVTV